MGSEPPPSVRCGDDCVSLQLRSQFTSSLLFSALPFVVTFSVISIVVLHRLFPTLCGADTRHNSPEGRLRKRIAAIAFSTTMGATGVLAELVLCEVSDWGHGDARRLAFRVVVAMLLLCLIVVIPLLELHELVESSRAAMWEKKFQTLVVTAGFAGWLWVFWSIGDILPIRSAEETRLWTNSRTWSEECLARVGVVGVSLMALLSGFGCVSTPWHNIATKQRPVLETDIARTQAGWEATMEMLGTKRNQLRALEKKVQEKRKSQEGLMSKMMSSIRGGDADSQEYSTLTTEVSGLETMRVSLAAELADLQRRQVLQNRTKTTLGRFVVSLYWCFSIYCVYRLAATTIAHTPFLHRRNPDSSFSQNDPINNVLALLAAYWDPHLDRAAWSRQIGFLLSGVIIAGSLGSVMTTLNMLSRAAPGVVSQAVKGDNPSLALFVSQLSAVYVLASALLLRSNLPLSMSTVITESLGAPLDPSFVDHWFDGVFLGAAALTALTIGVGRRLKKWRMDEDVSLRDLEGLEAGMKRS